MTGVQTCALPILPVVGTVFFVGYDDHYRQGNQIDERLFPTDAMLRTNRALFTKLQYLFRY